MQASLRSHHHHHHQQQQQQSQQYYDQYQACDQADAATYEASIVVDQQAVVASFDQTVYQEQQQQQHQQHLNAPCAQDYQAGAAIYYDLSQTYDNNAAQTSDEPADQHHQHQLKVIELQETYHQQQLYVNESVPTEELPNGANYSSTAIYSDPFAQTNCMPHESGYTQNYLTQPPYYTTLGGEQNDVQDSQQCYQAPAVPLAYYEAPNQLGAHLADEAPLERQQLDAASINVYQPSQINYQQLEESRKEHEQQTFVGQRSLRAAGQHQALTSERTSFSSALSTSSSCISANSAKLFSNDEDASFDDDESEDSTLPRDQKKAREANIPLSYSEIVNLSIDQFNEHIARFHYSEAQLTLMKDIRRRGKNKVAAQTCRKRKMEQIMELQHEVGQLANRRMALSCDLNRLIQEHMAQADEYERLYSVIQVHMSKAAPASVSGLKQPDQLAASSAPLAANDRATTHGAC